MKINYKQCESKERPLEIDVTSSPNGVYVRRNIELVIRGESESEVYTYQEAFLTKSEYEKFSRDLLVGQINDEDNSKEYEDYKNKLDSGVLFTNGHLYKPKWASIYYNKAKEVREMFEIYGLTGGESEQAGQFLNLKINVYDVTQKQENAVQMTVKEICELWLFLTQVQEQYFNEYKASLFK